MGSFRTPGPVCSTRAGGDEASSPFAPPAPAASYLQPGSLDAAGMTPEEAAIACDLLRLAHELLHLPPPPPFSSVADLLARLDRPELLRAELGTISLVPTLADLVKTGQLSKYARTLEQATRLARRHGALALQLRPALVRIKELLDLVPLEILAPKLRSLVEELKQPVESCLGGLRAFRRVWWEVVRESPDRIDGSSIPVWIELRVGHRRFRVERNAAKKNPQGTAIGPATKHLAEKGLNDPARDFARMGGKQSWVDFPISSLAAALESAEQLLKSGRAVPGTMMTVEAWELGINTKSEPWIVYHAVYNPKL